MRITKRQLKRIIKEERQKLLKEESASSAEESADAALRNLLEAYMTDGLDVKTAIGAVIEFCNGWEQDAVDRILPLFEDV